ncbi:hypothetical protein [Actinophytocola sp.]|uniref:hypothetical protein n=1 Tax=Actinophytocola sp. TaxID=1872138 RepID=UPI003D6AF789
MLELIGAVSVGDWESSMVATAKPATPMPTPATSPMTPAMIGPVLLPPPGGVGYDGCGR